MGINYSETCALIFICINVHFLLTITKIIGLETQVVDFVLVFTQIKLEVPVCTFVQAGMELSGIDNDAHHIYILMLKKSLSELKQASANCAI